MCCHSLFIVVFMAIGFFQSPTEVEVINLSSSHSYRAPTMCRALFWPPLTFLVFTCVHSVSLHFKPGRWALPVSLSTGWGKCHMKRRGGMPEDTQTS